MVGRRVNLRGGEKEGRFLAGFLLKEAFAIVEKDPVRQNVPIEDEYVLEGNEKIITPEKSGWGGRVNIFANYGPVKRGGLRQWSGKVRLGVRLLSKLEANLGDPRVRESLPIYLKKQGLL